MAISFISTKCPNCGAELEIEQGRDMAFCTYCGGKVILHNENEYTINKTTRTIDETEIARAQADRDVRIREMELREQASRSAQKMKLLYLGIGIFFGLLSLAGMLFRVFPLILCFIPGIVLVARALKEPSNKTDNIESHYRSTPESPISRSQHVPPQQTPDYRPQSIQREKQEPQIINNYYYGSDSEKNGGRTTQMSNKSRRAALAIWFFLGLFGGHYFYVGRPSKGFLYMFTIGLCGFGWFFDFFSIVAGKFLDKDGLPVK